MWSTSPHRASECTGTGSLGGGGPAPPRAGGSQAASVTVSPHGAVRVRVHAAGHRDSLALRRSLQHAAPHALRVRCTSMYRYQSRATPLLLISPTRCPVPP
eukprot:1515069-Rhodomonas_salina.3